MKEDPGFYDYWAYQNRPKIKWPNGAKVAFWVAPNIEFYELNPPDNPQRKPWPQAAPAVAGYSIRDYGNRVGHMRQMQVLEKYGVRGSISLSTALCDHHPEIIELCKERNWEFFSHGIYNARYTYGNAPGIWRRPCPILNSHSICLPRWAVSCLVMKAVSIPAICSMTTSPHPFICVVAKSLSLFLILWK